MKIMQIPFYVLLGSIVGITCAAKNSKGKSDINLTPYPDVKNELITMGAEIGIRNGKKVKFYDGSNAWRYQQNKDFSIPDDVDELITMGAKIGVRNGKTVKFYDGSNAWKYQQNGDFNIPGDVGELITMGAKIGVWSRRTIKFYDGSNAWKHLPFEDLGFMIDVD